MQYMVIMALENNGGSLDGQHAMEMITRFVLPSVEALAAHEEQGTVVGGPVAASARFVFIARADSAADLESLLTSLPFWSVMKVEITSLVTFKDRVSYIHRRLEQVKPAASDPQ